MGPEPYSALLSRLLPELSTQMRYALGNLHIASAAITPAEAREQDPALDRRAAVFDQAYYQLLRLVNNLSFAAYLDEQTPMPTRDRDIVGVVEGVCRQCSSLADLLGIELRFLCPRSTYVCAIYRDSIEQLLFQLLSNAFKATPKGGCVTVELKFPAGQVRLSVSDTGCGIPQDQLPHLFTRYLEEDSAVSAQKGLGLGLPICRRIAEQHGGRIAAESREGAGTRIILTLPDRRDGIYAVEDMPFDYAGGFNRTLMGLADALPLAAFCLREQD